MSQCDRLEEWLRRGKRIDPLTSWKELGIYRLSARIYDLRLHRGMKIKSRNAKRHNRYGESVTVAEYYL